MAAFFRRFRLLSLGLVFILSLLLGLTPAPLPARDRPLPPNSVPLELQTTVKTVSCDLLVVGGGLSGVAAAYEALYLGQTVCLTEITDWLGGQVSAQGVSALDEAKQQRSLSYFPRGYNELRQHIEAKYGMLNPGDCWVSLSCFLPNDAQQLLTEELANAAAQGGGRLKWFPTTVIKDLEYSPNGQVIAAAIAIQHQPATGALPLNSEPLSQILDDVYRYADSARLHKQILRFVPQTDLWFVVDATETGELIALTQVPYQLGIDPRSHLNPSSPVIEADPYCTQGFTYTFAMEQTANAQPQQEPAFYQQYRPYYGYDANPRKASFDFVFTYRRIWSPVPRSSLQEPNTGVSLPKPGDITMQNWVWGNDYRPGKALDNLIYTPQQLQATGQLSPGGWLGGLRPETLRKGEELALGFYYWLVADNSDSQLSPSLKKPMPNHRLL